MIALGDPSRVDVIVSNALRNAVESSAQADTDEPVIVTWDATDQDVFVAIVDSGVGLAPGLDKAFEFGLPRSPRTPIRGLALRSPGKRLARWAVRSPSVHEKSTVQDWSSDGPGCEVSSIATARRR